MANRGSERWKRDYVHDGRIVTITFYRRPETTQIACAFSVHGRRRRLSTEKEDPSAAEVRGFELYLRELATTPAKVARGEAWLTLRQWAAWDLERAEDEERNEGYQETLNFNWANLRRILGENRMLTDITPDDLDEYRRARKRETTNTGRKVSNQTIAKELTCLKRAARKALGMRELRAFPAWKEAVEFLLAGWPKPEPKDPADPTRTGKVRDVETLQLVWSKASRDLKDELVVGFWAAGRAEEIKRWQCDWFVDRPLGEGVNGYLELPPEGTKANDAPTVIPLVGPAYEIVKRRVEDGPTHGFIFSQVDHRSQLRRLSDELGVNPRLKMRDLRKTVGTLAAGSNLHNAQSLLRHASPTTTARHYVDRQAAGALAAVQGVHAELGPALEGLAQSEWHSPPEPGKCMCATLESEGGKMVRAVGIEPATYGLRVPRNSIVLLDYVSPDRTGPDVVSGTYEGAPAQFLAQVAFAAEVVFAGVGGLS